MLSIHYQSCILSQSKVLNTHLKTRAELHTKIHTHILGAGVGRRRWVVAVGGALHSGFGIL